MSLPFAIIRMKGFTVRKYVLKIFEMFAKKWDCSPTTNYYSALKGRWERPNHYTTAVQFYSIEIYWIINKNLFSQNFIKINALILKKSP